VHKLCKKYKKFRSKQTLESDKNFKIIASLGFSGRDKCHCKTSQNEGTVTIAFV